MSKLTPIIETLPGVYVEWNTIPGVRKKRLKGWRFQPKGPTATYGLNRNERAADRRRMLAR